MTQDPVWHVCNMTQIQIRHPPPRSHEISPEQLFVLNFPSCVKSALRLAWMRRILELDEFVRAAIDSL
jgi:hypothetical protein